MIKHVYMGLNPSLDMHGRLYFLKFILRLNDASVVLSVHVNSECHVVTSSISRSASLVSQCL